MISTFHLPLSTLLYWFLLLSFSNHHHHQHHHIIVANASSFNEPHAHNGVVSPFEPGKPNISLDKKALSILKEGKPYQTQVQKPGASGGRGLVVQDINAPSDVVWDRILDYDNYNKMVPKTIESKNYNVVHMKPTKKNPLEQIIYTRMKVGFPVLKLEFFIKHLYFPSLNSLTWTLDYSKNSDFNDSCGYWYVIPHPDDEEERTRVYYSVEVSMFDWVPKFVVDFMSTKALTDATAWVKKYSELEYTKQDRSKNKKLKSNLSSSSNTDETKNITPNKKRKGLLSFFGKLFRNKKKEEIKKRLAEEEAKRIAEEERIKAEEEARKVLQLSWIRLGLVSVVVILAIYDFHLWLSS